MPLELGNVSVIVIDYPTCPCCDVAVHHPNRITRWRALSAPGDDETSRGRLNPGNAHLLVAVPGSQPSVIEGRRLNARIIDQRVRPTSRPLTAKVENNGLTYTFPAHSLTILKLKLK